MTHFRKAGTSGAPPFFYKDSSEQTRPDQFATTRPCAHLRTQDIRKTTPTAHIVEHISHRPLELTNCATYLDVTEKQYRTRSTRFVGWAPRHTRSSRDSQYPSVIAGSDRGARAAPNKLDCHLSGRIPARTMTTASAAPTTSRLDNVVPTRRVPNVSRPHGSNSPGPTIFVAPASAL